VVAVAGPIGGPAAATPWATGAVAKGGLQTEVGRFALKQEIDTVAGERMRTPA